MRSQRVAVVGGGVIGSTVALRLAEAGVSVTVYDRGDSTAASGVAAGLLAPVTETGIGDTGLLDLMITSARLWPGFAAELNRYTDVAYRACGTLLVGLDDVDRAELDRHEALCRRSGIAVKRHDGNECRVIEPGMSRLVRDGLSVPEDHQVNPRRVMSALVKAGGAVGVQRVAADIDDVSALEADRVVVAAGSWSSAVERLPVRPVSGQVVRLRSGASTPVPGRCVRAIHRGRSVYIVPRVDGEVVIGASHRETGYDGTARAGETAALLTAAVEVFAELSEYHVAEINVGFRPGTDDNAPILGPVGDGRVVAATGHYRNGILLAPITAHLISRYIVDGVVPADMTPFSVDRFA